MTSDFRTEIVRLADNEPLVLACSALTDFLWGDFVRDSSPRVNYLIDRYDIRKLSRFGKELFEHFYQGDNVTPLISLNDSEAYFRATQNGENPEPPKNYKPENAFWIGLMNDLTNSPAWDMIAPRAIGDQFVSGNNAILILNKLSEIINVQIDEGQMDPQSIGQVGEKLKDLRSKFMQARAAGDLDKAAEIREEGKQLGKKLEDYQNQVRDQMRPQVQEAIDKAAQEASDIEEAMNILGGDNQGTGHRQDIQEKLNLANKLRNNRKLMKLADRLGAMRRAWNNRKRARMAQANYSDIVGAKFGDSVVQAFPSELALAATDEGKALFALKYSQKTILSKDYEAKTKDIGQGPILMYVDVSGSMQGDSELWSKAIAYVVAEEALKQKRSVQIVLFDNYIQETIKIEADASNKDELLEFVAAWSTHGGTSFAKVIDHAISYADIDKRADILMITDGHSEVPDPFIRRLNLFKAEKHCEWHSFCIGERSETLELFSDHIQLVDINNDATSADLFQNVLL